LFDKLFSSKSASKPKASGRRTGASGSKASSSRGTAGSHKHKQSSHQDRSSTGRRRASGSSHKSRSVNEHHRADVSLQQRLVEHANWSAADYQVPAKSDHLRFKDLGLQAPILHAIHKLSYQYCTPIQAKTLPATLLGKDAVGKAQTGTGKTAAFLLTALQHLLDHPELEPYSSEPRVLALAPTRELALQIAKDAEQLAQFTDLNIITVIGGSDYEKQKVRLQRERVDLLVATPGRLIDFMQQQVVFLDQVEILVIDEADRMLDMGFMPDVRRIVRATPPVERRQTLFFSATFSTEILLLTERWLQEPVRVEIEPEQVAAEVIDQSFYWVSEHQKAKVTAKILEAETFERVIIFANRRDVCRKLHENLKRQGCQNVLLSGEIHQSKRVKTLDRFKRGECRVMVATDVAGRGIHIDGVSLVINYELPDEPEDYVHRIGRTGRAGQSGKSISLVDENGGFSMPPLSRYLGHDIPLLPLPLDYEVN
jgi:ATP-dependent RNA helicase RhlB